MGERFTALTIVRRPRDHIAVAVLLATVFSMLAFIWHRSWLPYGVVLYAAGLLLANKLRHPKIEHASVEASGDGLRVDGKRVPRVELTSALLRRGRGRTVVVLRLRSRGAIEVEVASDEQAGALCRALALDAASTTAELVFVGPARRWPSALRWTFVGFAVAMLLVGIISAALHAWFIPLVTVLALLAFAVVAIPVLVVSRQVKIRVGADGLAVRIGLSSRFVRHEEIASVRASGSKLVIETSHAPPLEVSGHDVQAAAWRIEEAREAYRAHAGGAPTAVLALGRGEKTVAEWLEQLRRVGAGATASFRGSEIAREQLLGVLESTSTEGALRVAAAAALHDAMAEHEIPRVRVAAGRCAQPALGDAMIRVALAPTHEELERAFDEFTSSGAPFREPAKPARAPRRAKRGA